MSFSDLKELQVADGKITRLVYESGELSVWLVDWQGNKVSIRFENAEGFIASSPENEDLSHVFTSDDMPRELVHELDESENYKLVVFVSAWDDRELVRVVASNAVVKLT